VRRREFITLLGGAASHGARAAGGDAGDHTDHRKGAMKTRRSSLSIGWLLVVCAFGGFAAQAQDYPTRSVKLITQGAAASGPDVIARIVAEHLGRLWGQQVIILNHPGAGGSVAARQAASAAADGYTLYMPATSAFIVMPQMFPNLPFDLNRDFVRIGFIAEQPMVIAVAPSLGVNSLRDLIALAKKRPGHLDDRGELGTPPPHSGGTPDWIVRKVGHDLQTVLDYPELRQKLADLATFTRPMSPAETTEFILREQELWHPVVKQIGASQ